MMCKRFRNDILITFFCLFTALTEYFDYEQIPENGYDSSFLPKRGNYTI